jgi:hypothetical protein
MKVVRVEIDPSGKIVLVGESRTVEYQADLDRWLEKHDARPA